MSELKDTTPLMRGQQVAANLKSLEVFRPEERRAIAQEIPTEMLEIIKSRKLWVPVEADMVLCGAVHRLMGDEHLGGFSRQCIVTSAGDSVLTPLLKGAARLLRLNPGSFITFGPTAWRSIYRHFGEFAYVDQGKNQAEAHLVELPEMAFEHVFYFQCIGGAFQGVLDAGGMKGEVKLISVAPDKRTVKYRITWD